jgi:hypothetical protein
MAECSLNPETTCLALTEAHRQFEELKKFRADDRQVLKATRDEWAEREHKLHDQLKTASQTIATLEAKVCADRNRIAHLEGKIAFLEVVLTNVRLNESRCLRELGERAERISDLNADRAKLQEIANTAKLDLAVARSAAEGWRARADGLGSDTQLTCDLSVATATVAALRKTNIGLIAERDSAESLRYVAQKYSKEMGDQLHRIRSELTESVEEKVNTQDIARRVRRERDDALGKNKELAEIALKFLDKGRDEMAVELAEAQERIKSEHQLIRDIHNTLTCGVDARSTTLEVAISVRTELAEAKAQIKALERQRAERVETIVALRKNCDAMAMKLDAAMTDITVRSCRKLAAYDAIKELVACAEVSTEGKNVDGTV